MGERHPRIMRWLEFLASYDYTLKYRKGCDNGNADFLSRLPQPVTSQDLSDTCRLTEPTDVGIYFVGASGIWPSHISAAQPGSVLQGPPLPTGTGAFTSAYYLFDFRRGEGEHVVVWGHPPQVNAVRAPQPFEPVYALERSSSTEES